MRTFLTTALILACLATEGLPQVSQKAGEGSPIRISAQLVQLDVVVTDKEGRLITDLTQDDFTVLEGGKKQRVGFFEFVSAGAKSQRPRPGEPAEQAARQELSATDLKRVFAFAVDDLTIGYEDLAYIRQTLTHFVDHRMAAGDLVAIVRTAGGKGLLQQFTSNKELLRRAIASLTPRPHPLAQAETLPSPPPVRLAADIAGEPLDLDSSLEDLKESLRSYMTLSTAGFVIDSMKELPGRKSLVLISGGLPVLTTRPKEVVGDALHFLNRLTDSATRAGVAIHTLDVRGLSAGFSRTTTAQNVEIGPTVLLGGQMAGRLPTGGDTVRGGPDRGIYSRSSGIYFSGGRLTAPGLFTPVNAQYGLRVLAYATGGIPILNKNDLNDGLGRIAGQSEGYYLLAYTPSDAKFDNRFRSVEIKVNRPDARVLYRRGYFAREDEPAAAPATRPDQILATVRSPLTRRDIALDAMLLYKSVPDGGGVDIHLVIDPEKLQFNQADGKQEASFDVAGFVFDEFGKLRGGFNDTIEARLTDEEMKRASAGGLSYSANTVLRPGAYQVRLAVKDNKSDRVGTLSRYIEIPDLSKGRLAASSLLLGAVPPGDTKAASPTPVSANRQISCAQDLRYATIIYNAKLKEGKPQVRTQLVISQNGQVIFKEPEEQVAAAGDKSQLIKWGQLGLKGVRPGRYTLTLVITDPLADKKAQTITRNMDFVVVN